MGLKGFKNRVRIGKDVEEVVSKIEKHRRSEREIDGTKTKQGVI